MSICKARSDFFHFVITIISNCHKRDCFSWPSVHGGCQEQDLPGDNWGIIQGRLVDFRPAPVKSFSNRDIKKGRRTLTIARAFAFSRYCAQSSITASSSRQIFWTELICTFSSGECAPWMFGPKLTMSSSG